MSLSESVRADQISLRAGPLYQQLARTKDDMRIGEFAFHRPIVITSDRYRAPTLGMGVLRHYDITFDLKNKRARFRPARPGVQRGLPTVRWGFQVAEQSMVISSVFRGSGAESAGLQKGDLLVSVNDITDVTGWLVPEKFWPDADSNIKVKIKRDDVEQTLVVKVRQAIP